MGIGDEGASPRLVTPRCESGRGPVPDSRQIGARIGARFPIPGESGPGARDQAQIGARARDRDRERNGNFGTKLVLVVSATCTFSLVLIPIRGEAGV